MNLFQFLQYRISMLFLLIYLAVFISHRYEKITRYTCLAVCFFLTQILDYVHYLAPKPLDKPVLITILEALIVQSTAILLSKKRDFRALFTGLSASVFLLPGNIISSVLFQYTHHIYCALCTQIVIQTLFIIGMIYTIYKPYQEELELRDKGWLELCAFPIIFYILIYSLATWPSNIYETPQNTLGIFLVLLAMMLSYVLAFSLIAEQRKESHLENDNASLKIYADGLKHEAKTMEETELQNAIVRHDRRHYIAMVSRYLDEGDVEGAKQLLKEVDQQILSIRPKHFCQNSAIDGVLSRCAYLAEQKNIAFHCQTMIPDNLPFEDFLLAGVISNLSENAVIAAGKVTEPSKRFVRIHMGTVKKRLVLEIANSYEEKVETKKETGFPLSKKGDGHGYGLRSVQAFANMNQAVFDYEIEKEVFHVRMSIPLNKT